MDNNSQTIDYSNLYTVANNDEDFIKDLIKIFLDQIPVFIRNLNQQFTEKHFEKLAREAHTAKSSVMIFGMTNAGLLLNKIELWAENEKIDEIGPALETVINDLNLAMDELTFALKTEKFK